MKTFVIKKEHLDKDNFYIGSEEKLGLKNIKIVK